MPDSTVLSIAVMEPFHGYEEEFMTVLHDLYSLMESKGYSRDILLRNPAEPTYFINVRYWKTPEMRQEAHEDPDVHRCWARLGHQCKMVRVHQTLDEIDWRTIGRLQKRE